MTEEVKSISFLTFTFPPPIPGFPTGTYTIGLVDPFFFGVHLHFHPVHPFNRLPLPPALHLKISHDEQ